MSGNGILVVGSANMDMVSSMQRFPHPGETVFGTSFGMFPGGKGANQAVCAAKLGAKVTFLGKMGNDIFRDQLKKNMEQAGVAMDHLFIDDTLPTGTALITVDCSGQNEIVVISGSNMRLTPEDVEQKHQVFRSAAVTLLQLEVPLETIFRAAVLAKENHHLLILNPAPARKLPAGLIKLIDYLTPNETEAEILTGIPIDSLEAAEAAGNALLKQGVKQAVITLGAGGCLLVNADGTAHFAAPLVKPVDTTAAGDALNGALAAALAQGQDVHEAVRFAVHVAALSVTRMGAQSSLPTLEEVEQYYGAAMPVDDYSKDSL